MENCVYIFLYSLCKRTYLKPPTIPTFAIRHQPLGVAKMAAARAQNIPSCQKCPVLVLEKWAYLHGCIIACFKAPNSNAFNAWCRWQVTDVFPCWRFFLESDIYSCPRSFMTILSYGTGGTWRNTERRKLQLPNTWRTSCWKTASYEEQAVGDHCTRWSMHSRMFLGATTFIGGQKRNLQTNNLLSAIQCKLAMKNHRCLDEFPFQVFQNWDVFHYDAKLPEGSQLTAISCIPSIRAFHEQQVLHQLISHPSG